jgi:hypothetical protein
MSSGLDKSLDNRFFRVSAVLKEEPPMATEGVGPRPLSRRLLMSIALITSLLAIAGYAQSRAHAVGVGYCVGVYLGGYDHCDASERHSLTANIAANYYGSNTSVCAGATLNGSFWGGYACSNFGWAEHCYDGTRLLVGRIHNGQSVAQHMQGAYYYSEACP